MERDSNYAMRMTLLQLAAVALIDGLIFYVCRPSAGDPTLVWSAGGVLICLPWGRAGVIVSMLFGLAVGAAAGLLVRALLINLQRPFAQMVAAGQWHPELIVFGVWAAAFYLTYHLANAVLFPGLSGIVAAPNVFAGRALAHQEIVDLYWAARVISKGKAGEAAAVPAVGRQP